MNVFGFSKEQQLKVQQKKCLDLKARLEKGWSICEASPDDKRLEDHWLKLLSAYESSVFEYVTLGGSANNV